jgi:hypothetical protein
MKEPDKYSYSYLLLSTWLEELAAGELMASIFLFQFTQTENNDI